MFNYGTTNTQNKDEKSQRKQNTQTLPRAEIAQNPKTTQLT